MKREKRKVKNPNANVVFATIINKTIVPTDLCSAGIKYQDLFNPLKIPLI